MLFFYTMLGSLILSLFYTRDYFFDVGFAVPRRLLIINVSRRTMLPRKPIKMSFLIKSTRSADRAAIFSEIARDRFEACNYAGKKTGLASSDFTTDAFTRLWPPLVQIRFWTVRLAELITSCPLRTRLSKALIISTDSMSALRFTYHDNILQILRTDFKYSTVDNIPTALIVNFHGKLNPSVSNPPSDATLFLYFFREFFIS